MSEEIEVSVIVPIYNAKKYVEQAIESVCIQDVRWELLLIDDCSTDGSSELLDRYEKMDGIQVIHNEKNMGVAETRNVGIRMARGKYVAFLDADDWWDADKLKRQCEFLAKEDAVLCYTGRELMKADGSSMDKVIKVPEQVTWKMLLRTNYIPCSSVVIKTEVAREFYMEHAELHEDYILWLKVLKKYGMAYGINEPMLKSRMSEDGKSRNKIKSAVMQWKVYRFMGIGSVRALWYMMHYVINGLKKYC